MEQPTPPPEFRQSLQGLPYDRTIAGDPPVFVKSSTSPHRPDPSVGKDEPNLPTAIVKSKLNTDEWGQTSSSLQASSVSVNTEIRSISSRTSARSVPQIRVDNDPTPTPKHDGFRLTLRPQKSKDSLKKPSESFQGLALEIPTGGLSEEISADNMKFSHRGSMLLDGDKARSVSKPLSSRKSSQRSQANHASTAKANLMSVEEESLSQKVRSFYDLGTDGSEHGDASTLGRRMGLRWQDALMGAENSSVASVSRATSTTDLHSDNSATTNSRDRRESQILREDNELAGGIEDWQDVQDGHVDRYGFIVPRSPVSTTTGGVQRSATVSEGHTLQRVSTSLQLASETPRRKLSVRRTPTQRSGRRRSPSPMNGQTGGLSDSRLPSAQRSHTEELSYQISSIRHATNKLPQNRDRKLRDEAGYMFTLSPLERAETDNAQASGTDRARRKEIEREEKWRKMAKLVSSKSGGGMIFDFDPSNPKVIERTWKGIPDRWRATAWHAFLSASARKRRDAPSDDQLIHLFHEYQSQSSPDDVQIDIDVPRTISSHIMFRRRYRGGQRLLFRVLRAMSLHYPDTGYVQGMAALAATFLSYYEEERAFIMMVRLWDLRGLDKLYKSGFGGLMQALDDFETRWLGGGEVAGKLNELGVSPTAYGTRWYLTLFNYSIPFPAQLRVWDVFMLLGGDNDSDTFAQQEKSGAFGTTLDVLHATSAALIDGMRAILLDSDFENAMKVLTSWIPIRDEDLFMRVAKVEWKVHKRKT